MAVRYKYLPVRHCISWKYSGLECSSQGVVSSSAVQTLASLICPLAFVTQFITSYILCGVSVATLTYNKRVQHPRAFLGTEIQTSCNFKADPRDRYCLMDFARTLFCDVVLESSYNLMVWHHGYTTVSSNLNLLLHKDFFHRPST